MTDLDRRLSEHFTLGELLYSATAQRRPALLIEQENPSGAIVRNLEHLVTRTLEPIRRGVGLPLRVTSGYRSPGLNRAVGGARTSQHLLGQAADLHLVLGMEDPGLPGAELEEEIAATVRSMTGRPMRQNVSADFLLFAWIALRLKDLDVDQLIHEYGAGPGRPAWVHVSASPGAGSRRQILVIDRSGTRLLDLRGALSLGT